MCSVLPALQHQRYYVPSGLRYVQPDTTVRLLQPAAQSTRHGQWSWWSGLWPPCPIMTTYLTSGDPWTC